MPHFYEKTLMFFKFIILNVNFWSIFDNLFCKILIDFGPQFSMKKMIEKTIEKTIEKVIEKTIKNRSKISKKGIINFFKIFYFPKNPLYFRFF